jgi:hypothetical protein
MMIGQRFLECALCRPSRTAPSARAPWRIAPLLGLVSIVAAADQGPLSPIPLIKPDVSDDPHWVRQLPPVILPLPKPAELTTPLAHPSPREGGAAAAGGELAQAPGIGDPRAGDATRTEHPPKRSTADAATDAPAGAEPTEDAAMSEVLETQIIGPPTAGLVTDPVSSLAIPGIATPEVTSPRYRWHVQLLAGRSLAKVEADSRAFASRYATLLQGHTLAIDPSRSRDGRDVFYRLRVLEWTTPEPARVWCEQLRASGHQCLVTRVTVPQ